MGNWIVVDEYSTIDKTHYDKLLGQDRADRLEIKVEEALPAPPDRRNRKGRRDDARRAGEFSKKRRW